MLPEVVGNWCVFPLCEGGKPEGYLVSLTVADPQNKPKLIKVLQEHLDTENHWVFYVKDLTFGRHEFLVACAVEGVV